MRQHISAIVVQHGCRGMMLCDGSSCLLLKHLIESLLLKHLKVLLKCVGDFRPLLCAPTYVSSFDQCCLCFYEWNTPAVCLDVLLPAWYDCKAESIVSSFPVYVRITYSMWPGNCASQKARQRQQAAMLNRRMNLPACLCA